MKLLSAINNILPHLGENPVTSVDIRHPTVALVQDAINEAKLMLLSQGWWFNERNLTLYPSPEGEIYAPDNVLAFYCLDGQEVDIRGERMYDIKNGTYFFTRKVEARVIDDLTFEELPNYAALVVMYAAAHNTYTKDFGVESVVQYLMKLETEARIMLQQEELRKRKYNSLKNNRAFRFLKVRRA